MSNKHLFKTVHFSQYSKDMI